MKRAFFVVAPLLVSACSFFVEFKDPVDDDGGADSGVVESGAIVPEAGAPADSGTSAAQDAAPDDAATVADTNPPPFTCAGQPNGTPVPNSTDRCCSGTQTAISTTTNCGACGIVCDTSKGQSCVLRDGHYYCIGCARDGGGSNSGCWSGCCTTPFLSPEGVCAPELPCGFAIPVCDDGSCNAHGASCHTNAPVGTYCE